jgi:L-ascorbate metabolism protein UlaG (beta-lactamase superfamily)
MSGSNGQKVYLKQNVQFEPLFNDWYAWFHMVPPVTAALNVLDRYLPIMNSYVNSPALHAAAVKNPAMRGGPFIDLDGKRIDEVKALAQSTQERSRHLVEFARAIKQLGVMLPEKAKGLTMEKVYDEVPEILKGYVELVYDLNHNPSFRVLESLLYRSQYYDESLQSISLSLIEQDDQRPFILSTPRLPDEKCLHLSIPFSSPALDALFRMKHEPRSYQDIAEQLGVDEGADALFRTFFTEQAPRPRARFDGEGFRIRYFGHACVFFESKDVSILLDPIVSYSYASDLARYTFEDLPEHIDFVCITHSHHDHIALEALLQLRHKIGTIIVGRNGDGFPHDPSLQLALQRLGFRNVVEGRDMQEFPFPGGSIVTLPFLGEHNDLSIQSKTSYLVRFGSQSMLCIADSCNLAPQLYDHIFKITGEPQRLFLGMECEGAPSSWVYGPLFPKPLPREINQSRRARGCNFDEAMQLIDRANFKEVYVYAMGQEPWLNHILDNAFTETSLSLTESRRMLEWCSARGIQTESLFAQKEIVLSQG